MLLHKWNSLVLNVFNHHMQKHHDKALGWLQEIIGFPTRAQLQQLTLRKNVTCPAPSHCLEEADALFLLHLLRSQATALLRQCDDYEADSVRLQMERAAEGLHFLLSGSLSAVPWPFLL